MAASLDTTLSLLRRWGANGAIVVLLGLMLLQTWPGVPLWLRWRADYLAERTGLWQSAWNMFAPEPDQQNHRIRIEITYADGRTATWRSPEWSERTAWQRFVGHRYSEYIDALSSPYFSHALPDLAEHSAAELRTDPAPGGRPRSVEVWLDVAEIPDPELHGWRPRRPPPPFERHSLEYFEEYP